MTIRSKHNNLLKMKRKPRRKRQPINATQPIEEIKRRIVEILNKYHLHKYDNPMQQDLEDLHDSI